jgi:hypothetical protein
MYCSNCGAESTVGLNYCKRCGANLSESTQNTDAPARNVWAALILAIATTGIVLGGFGIISHVILGLVGPQPEGMKADHDGPMVAGLMLFFGAGTITLVTMMLIKLFSRVMGFGRKDEREWNFKKFVPAKRVPQIPAAPVSMESVTEHTTRNFEPRMYRRDAAE